MADSDSAVSGLLAVVLTVLVNLAWWAVMITAIVFGSRYQHDCTIQPFIPIYLIVFGVSSIISLCMTSGSKEGNSSTLTCMSFLHIFNFCWLITGSVWIYSIYPPNYTPGVNPYCHKTTYLLAFSITTVVWVACACVLICGCCGGILLGCGGAFTAASRMMPSRNSFYGATSSSALSGAENV